MKIMTRPEPTPFDAAQSWPMPDMSIAKPERPPAPSMADDDFTSVFGPWADWLKDAAQVKGAPVDYVALSLLATASAAIGNSRWACPWEGWKEPPILWVMLVGDPSAGKSPALDAVLDPVKDIERDLAEEYRQARADWDAGDEIASLALAQWKSDAKKALAEGKDAPGKPDDADAGKPPTRERVSISDATTEKVAELVAASWRGLLMQRDELSGWLGGMDRYNAGGDRPFWLEAYGGRSYTVDRKSSPEPVTVDRLSVAVLGGTQPDKLNSLLMKSDDDGLLARFLTVFPEPVALSRPTALLDDARLKTAIEQMRSLSPAYDDAGNPRPLLVHFTEPARDALQGFRGQCRSWEQGATGLMKSHIGKMPGMVVRVSCVLAHLDWAADTSPAFPDCITPAHVGRACYLVGEYLQGHAQRAYGVAGAPDEIRNAQRLANLILEEDHKRLAIRDIQRRDMSGLQRTAEIKAALGVLEGADWIQCTREETKGRPKTVYTVNPNLWGKS